MNGSSTAQRMAEPSAAARWVLGTLCSVAVSCRPTSLPTPRAPDDPDMSYPPGCASQGASHCLGPCDAGEPAACLWVAHALERSGPHHDPDRARALVIRACDRGYSRACAHWGMAIVS